MKPFLLLAVTLLLISPAASHADRQAAPERDGRFGPTRIANGESYSIHAFHGSVATEDRTQSTIGSGIVVFHTDKETDAVKWLIVTGDWAISTRRISYSHVRLLGIAQTPTQMACVFYHYGCYDQPAETLPADEGSYTISIYDKKTGKRISSGFPIHGLDRPNAVPGESFGEGVFLKNEDGFSMLGGQLLVKEDGSFQRVKLPEEFDGLKDF